MESLNGNVRLLPRVASTSLEGRLLTVRVVHPVEAGRNVRMHPETTAV